MAVSKVLKSTQMGISGRVAMWSLQPFTISSSARSQMGRQLLPWIFPEGETVLSFFSVPS